MSWCFRYVRHSEFDQTSWSLAQLCLIFHRTQCVAWWNRTHSDEPYNFVLPSRHQWDARCVDICFETPLHWRENQGDLYPILLQLRFLNIYQAWLWVNVPQLLSNLFHSTYSSFFHREGCDSSLDHAKMDLVLHKVGMVIKNFAHNWIFSPPTFNIFLCLCMLYLVASLHYTWLGTSTVWQGWTCSSTIVSTMSHFSVNGGNRM